MPPTPLPASTFASPSITSAYSLCRELETSDIARDYESTPPPDTCARVLGYSLVYLRPAGATNLAAEILACSSREDIIDLGAFIVRTFVRTFKRAKGRTPAPSAHPSRPSFEDQRSFYEDLLQEGSLNHERAKTAALVRDNYRCLFTGAIDMNAFEMGLLEHDGISAVQPTEAAHIIPQGILSDVDSAEAKRKWASSALAVLARFSQDINLPMDLNGSNIHRLENILSLTPTMHEMFDGLRLWLEETNQPNVYNLCATQPVILPPRHSNPIVLPSSEDLPPPSAEYIHLHATCARVAHMSGAGEYLDHLYRDDEKNGRASIIDAIRGSVLLQNRLYSLAMQQARGIVV